MARGRTVGKTGHRFASYLRHCGLAAAALLSFATFAAPGSADDEPVKATLAATVNGGFARLVFDMSEYDDASVRVANNVLVITFERPIDVSVDRLVSQIPDYVGAARRDPDGKGIRVALSQQVKVNATAAAEKYFIDLLPASWSGQPPSLPPEVIADLARRAREADRLERKERQAVAQQRATAEPVRVHAATQPTFTRYIFAVPANTAVSADRTKERLTLTFDAPIKFDLADVAAALPRAIGGSKPNCATTARWCASASWPRSMSAPSATTAAICSISSAPTTSRTSRARHPPRQPLRSKVRRRKPPRRQRSRPRRRTTLPRTAQRRHRRQHRKYPTSRHRQQSPRLRQRAGATAAAQAAPPPSPADKPAAAPKVEAQIAAPEMPPQPHLQPTRQRPLLRRQHRRHRNAMRLPCPTKLRPTPRRRRARAPPIPRARSQPSSPAKAPT